MQATTKLTLVVLDKQYQFAHKTITFTKCATKELIIVQKFLRKFYQLLGTHWGGGYRPLFRQPLFRQSQNSGVRTKSTLRRQGELEAQRDEWGEVLGSGGKPLSANQGIGERWSAVSYHSVVKGSFLSGAKPQPTKVLLHFGFFSELSCMVCNAILCAMLNVEKEVPGRPNHSSSPCPSPSSLSPLMAPDSPIGTGDPPLPSAPSPLPTSLSFPLPPLLLAHYSEGAWGAL